MGSHLRRGLLLLAGLATVVAALQISQFYTYTQSSAFGDEAILSSVLLGVAALLLVAAAWKKTALLLLLAGGAVLISKPLVYPMWIDAGFEAEGRVFSLTSETHLNFLVPGLLLVALAVILSLAIIIRAITMRDGCG